jgi:TctA family transporter
LLDAALAGLLLVVQWPAIGYLVLGVAIGLYFGAMPGLSGLVGLAILLPFTFGMDSGSAFALLLGMFAVTTSSDTIASVLLGIPGTVSSQATVLDGYPMAVRGEAVRAFGAAFTVSALGGVIGALFLGLSIPIVRPLILSFASPEFFLLGVLGLTMVGSLSGGSIVKGMLAAVLGLMLSMVGYAEMGAIARYHFGLNYLLEGVPLIPLVLGLFAVPEMLDLAIRGSSISRVPRDRVRGGVTQGIRDAFQHKWLVLRCSAIGIYVGMLPGLGGAIVDWVAYGHAVQSAGDKSRFGKGDVRGVIAPETANNAMKGGALIPTVAFGIPGSAPMALILGALTIQGLTPGPQMLTTELYVTFGLVWILVIANILGAGVLMLCATQIARVTFIRGHLIIPAVVLFVFMGAWMSSNAIGDWVALLVFGLIGYLMKQGGLPRPPVILGFILGPIMENALFITNQAYGPTGWLLRPVCLALILLVVGTVAYSLYARRRERKRPPSMAAAKSVDEDPIISLALVFSITAMFVYTTARAFDWYIDAAMFPIAIGVPAIALALLALYQDARANYRILSGNSLPSAWRNSSSTLEDLPAVAHFFLLMLGILGLTMLAGQRVALPLFILLYLRLWGRCGWVFAIAYALIGWLFLQFMFDQVVHVMWYPSFLED